MTKRLLFLVTTSVLSVGSMPAFSAESLVRRNATSVAHDQTYYTEDVRNTRLIFTEQNKSHAEHAAAVELLLQPLYEKSFGYVMDTRLSVGLMSSYNQIANGFSTQYPLNRQINYPGGAQIADYFSSTSWLETLLLHETAHNYQVNAKDNAVSSTLFKFLRNGVFYTPIIPAIKPNQFESNFILEGNAVLNESWHGRGGRLYSGRLRAMAAVHAKAGNLTRERLYNDTHHFPYGEGFYIFGSQYQYYLAKTHGLDKTNHYFKTRSRYWYWPFLVNAPTRDTFGIDFDRSFAAWVDEASRIAESMTLAAGDVVARSESFGGLNAQGNDIVFLAAPKGVRAPLLVRYSLADGSIDQRRDGFSMGRVFDVEGESYTVSGRPTSVWRTTQGLFDSDAVIKEGSNGHVVQGFMSDGREVYFDTRESFVRPSLYIDDAHYADVNSSVLVHEDNLYYFVQDGSLRTLYRNKEALYTLEGFYSIVADVDSDGAVLFIANSEHGSTLYRWSAGAVERVLAADNVIDARLAGSNAVLVAAISADDYYFAIETLTPIEQSPYVVRLFWDEPAGGSAMAVDEASADGANVDGAGAHEAAADEDSVAEIGAAKLERVDTTALNNLTPIPLTLDKKYGLFRNVRYSAGEFTIGSVQEEDETTDETKMRTTYSLQFRFEDPLTRSAYSLWAERDEDFSDLVGVGMSNNQFFLLAGLRVYHVVDDEMDVLQPSEEGRSEGVAAELRLPFVDWGFWDAEVAATYYQDYRLIEREPLALQLSVGRTERHGHSWFVNKQAALSAYDVEDRGDHTSGGTVNLVTDFPREFYLSLAGKLSDSGTDRVDQFGRRGVELRRGADFIYNDPSAFVISSLDQSTFSRRAVLAKAGLTKVFNRSAYFFTFPASIRREALTLEYRHYRIDEAFNAGDVEINQAAMKLNLDLLLMNKLPINFVVEAVHNDDDTITDRTHIEAGVAMPL